VGERGKLGVKKRLDSVVRVELGQEMVAVNGWQGRQRPQGIESVR
jgi:hypothetical protein